MFNCTTLLFCHPERMVRVVEPGVEGSSLKLTNIFIDCLSSRAAPRPSKPLDEVGTRDLYN